MSDEMKQTLILEIALPDYYAEDYRLDRDEAMAEALRLWFDVEDGADLTPEQLGAACLEDSGETSGGFVRLSLLTGSEGGNELQRVDGFIVGARVVPRTADHERERDERLIEHEEDWVRDEARRLDDDRGELDGVALIAAERRRQIDEEGWTPDHDDTHANGELALAGACYAIPAGHDTAEAIEFRTRSLLDGSDLPALWPWQHSWYKRGDRKRELAKAGALIAAELDRILREGSSPDSTNEGGTTT